jgi:hypothetical protein
MRAENCVLSGQIRPTVLRKKSALRGVSGHQLVNECVRLAVRASRFNASSEKVDARPHTHLFSKHNFVIFLCSRRFLLQLRYGFHAPVYDNLPNNRLNSGLNPPVLRLDINLC